MNDSDKKHILVISQYFYPEQFRINDICSEWVKRGYKVTVITGVPNYPQGKFYEGYGFCKKRKDTYQGIDIIRIPLIPRGKNPLKLALNYFSFVVSGWFWKVFTFIKADFVFIFEVSPMTQALPGVWYAKKRKIPCYLYVQDLWPENVEIITGIKNPRIIGSIGKMVDYIYRRCTKIFTTSKSFVEAIHDRGVTYDKIEYWPQYAEDFYQPSKVESVPEIPNDESFNVVFAGNIGQAQGLDILVDAAEIIRNKYEYKIRYNIIGDGRYREELGNIVKTKQLADVFNFIPRQPATRIPDFLSASDVAFLSLSDSPLFAMTIPAKLQSYMACGTPIIASAAGETANIIKESASGLCGSPGNAEELAANLVKLRGMTHDELKTAGLNARKYYDRNFDKVSLLDKIDAYFHK